MSAIDLNCDLGEGFDAWLPEGPDGTDGALLDLVTSANVACGYHAGDARTMAAVCARATARGVRIGAHVGYLDREGFGRRFVDVPPDELRAQVASQLGALAAVAALVGARVDYVKPHGALYGALVHHEPQARAVVEAVAGVDAALPIVGLPGSAVLALARAVGLRAVPEAFADRGYRADGTLVPRSETGAVVTDPEVVGARAARMAAERVVVAVDGSLVRVDAESVCVHSDTPGAVDLAGAVRRALEGAGVGIRPFVT